MSKIKDITEKIVIRMKKDWQNDNFFAGNIYTIDDKTLEPEEIVKSLNKILNKYIYEGTRNPYHVDLASDSSNAIAVFFDKPTVIHGSNKIYNWLESNDFNIKNFNVSSKEVIERLNNIFEWENVPYKATVVDSKNFCNIKAKIIIK